LLDKLASGRDFVPKYSGSRRITDEATLMEVKQVAGIIRSDVEAALFSSVSAPQRSKPPVIACGNFITARPLGVIDGVDMGYT
ncbi:amino-acid N-acetyltransferase, partial [Neisseria sp. P0015.S002]